MIVVQAADATLRRAIRHAASPEEDVIASPRLARRALERGFPRLLVRGEDARLDSSGGDGVPTLLLSSRQLARWEEERREHFPAPSSGEWFGTKLAVLLETAATSGSVWSDRALAQMARAAGGRLPLSFRAFARRALEFPSHYTTLHAMADVCGLSRGALKARFRRRDLASPAVHLRWLRLLSVAHVLADPECTVADAARRLGYTSDGNLCRTMWSVVRMTPSEARSGRGWNRILLGFVWEHLGADSLEGWSRLDELFEGRAA